MLALSSSLIAIGIWLDQQFDASRGPMRGARPEIVVWISLAAVGLVLAVWIGAELSACQSSASGSGEGES